MAISENNPHLNLLRKLSADSDTKIIHNSSSDFPQLPELVILAASRGWRLFPTPGECSVEGISFDDATSDLTQLGQRANDLSGFQWSLATGARSGVFVLEAQAPNGLTSLRSLSQLDWPETLYAGSSNYIIVFFLYPAGMRSIGAGRIEIVRGLTVISDGESVVLPPHESLRWPDPEAPVLESPEWLIELAFEPAEADPPIQEMRCFGLIRGGLYWRGRMPQQ